MAMHPLALLPELTLLVGALAALLGGSFLAQDRQWVARLVAVVALVVAAVAAAVALTGAPQVVYAGTFTADRATAVVRLVVCAATLLVIGLGVDELAGTPRESETYSLLLLSACGAMLLSGSSDLLLLIAAFLLTSVPLYGLIGLARTAPAAEATMKTYLLGALFGIVLMLGVTLLFGLAGGTTYGELGDRLATAPGAVVALGALAVLAGLLFEAGAVPAHFWVPDAAQGAWTSAAAFLTTVPKVGALVATYRFVDVLPSGFRWGLVVGLIAVVSMTLGNLSAYGQDDVRRLLGWSTVSQVGYLLVAVAVAGRSDVAEPALLLYLAGYSVTNLGAFAVVAAFPERHDLSAWQGLGRSHPALGAALLVCLLGLVGTPPAAVFTGKVTVSAAAWDGGQAWLVVALLLNSVASLFYYLRWIAPVYARGLPVERSAPGAFVARPWAAGAAIAAAVASLVLGVLAGAAWAVVG
jgi:NADH-quinone oxidoreductase subunit N